MIQKAANPSIMKTRPIVIISFFTLIASLIYNPSFASTKILIGKLENVVDGNTIIVLVGSETVRVRLYGIVCPDERKSVEDLTRNAIIDLIGEDQIEIIPEFEDRFGRVLANVYVGETNISEALIQKGYAIVCPEYCKKSYCSDWYSLERAARKQKIGMWSDPIFNR